MSDLRQTTTPPIKIEGIRILRFSQVKARTGLGRSTIYEKIGKGEFPAPIKLGARAVGWIELEVEQWLAQRSLHRSDAFVGTPWRNTDGEQS